MSKAAQIVKSCMNEQNLSQKKLAEMLGETPQNINQQLVRTKDMKADRMIEVLDKMGYRIEVVRKD